MIPSSALFRKHFFYSTFLSTFLSKHFFTVNCTFLPGKKRVKNLFDAYVKNKKRQKTTPANSPAKTQRLFSPPGSSRSVSALHPPS
jgi:hypothetical protein